MNNKVLIDVLNILQVGITDGELDHENVNSLKQARNEILEYLRTEKYAKQEINQEIKRHIERETKRNY